MAIITLRQSNVVFSTGNVIKGSPLTNAEVDNNFANLNVETTVLDANIGVLADLSTTEKSNVVSAINELYANVGSLSSGQIGDLNDLETTEKSNIVFAINELVVGLNNISSSSISNGTSNVSISENGNVVISTTFVPLVDDVYEIGSPTSRFNSMSSNIANIKYLNDSFGRTLVILDESNNIIWGG